MPAISRADFDALVNAILTVQTAPDSVTPTTLDDLFLAVSESYWNKVDGITVDGMTNFIPGVANGMQLAQILSSIMAQTGSQTNTNGMIPQLFRAEKTIDQSIGTVHATGSSFLIPFEDDSADPNYDTSNLFYASQFVANVGMTKTFAVEKFNLKQSSPGADTWKVQILKNGTEIAASAHVNSGITDTYGGSLTSTDGYLFPPVVASGVSLAAGDIVTVRLFCVSDSGSGTSPSVLTTHPAGKPCFSNA